MTTIATFGGGPSYKLDQVGNLCERWLEDKPELWDHSVFIHAIDMSRHYRAFNKSVLHQVRGYLQEKLRIGLIKRVTLYSYCPNIPSESIRILLEGMQHNMWEKVLYPGIKAIHEPKAVDNWTYLDEPFANKRLHFDQRTLK